MSKILNLIIVLCICTGLMQCTKNPLLPTGELPRELTSLEKSVVESSGNFGLKLFKEINKEERDKNVFISPLSVSMALGMTYNGANGSTEDAMQGTLELVGLTNQEINESYKSLIELLINLDPKVKFQIANSIWYRQEWTFEEVFLNLCKTYFNAEVSGLDFNDPSAPNIINGWVNENTNGKIEKILDSIDPLAVMFLINALYFKGTWTKEFDKKKTKERIFTLLDGTRKKHPMMSQSGSYRYYKGKNFQAVSLPYGNETVSMYIFLPDKNSSLEEFLDDLDVENWKKWMSKFHKMNGSIVLPRFKLEYEIVLNDVLSYLGMEVAFNPRQANFEGMCSIPPNVFIQEVKHKTFVEVNEEGTEAAAVTSVRMGLTSVRRTFRIIVDRPFFCAIRDNKTGAILFMGSIVEPK